MLVTMRSLATLVAAAVAVAAAQSSPPLQLNFNATTLQYSVSVGGRTFFTSAKAGYAASYNGTMHTSDRGLAVDSVTATNGAVPKLGAYTGWSVSFNDAAYVASFMVFEQLNAVIFQQEFPAGLTGTPVQNGDNDLATGFPLFESPAAGPADLAYVAWAHCMCGASVRLWNSSGASTDDFGREGGMAVFFDADGNALTMSAATNFMVAQTTMTTAAGAAFGAGINGRIDGLPAGFTHWTLMVGGAGINDTMFAHGDVLLALSGKQRTQRDADLVVSKLSYWSDNGATTYKQPMPNQTFQQTMLTVKDYLVNDLQLPVAYFQFDSWWYYKLPDYGAVTLWEPMPDVFPSGLSDWLGLPTVLHNRYFAPQNNYSSNYTFLTEPNATVSLPIDKRMFHDIMADKIPGWNMVQYEQDWLNVVYESIDATVTNVTAAHDWLTAMADAAAELNVTIQYCMPLPNFLLQSTLYQPVTNARASGDYHAGSEQFEIGLSSLYYYSMGIMPSKDDWWTTEVQPNPYPDNPTEPNWQLQAIVVALSMGPNGPSDYPGHTNKSLVMSTIRGDGFTMQPDRPAIVMDSAIQQVFATGGYYPQVWSTWSAHGGSAHRWQYLLAHQLGGPFEVTFDALGPSLAVSSYAVFDFFNPMGGAVAVLNATNPFTIMNGQGQPSAPATAHTFRYYIAAPVLPGGWVLYGEAGKIVPMAQVRFTELHAADNGFTIIVQGSAGEPDGITVLVVPPGATTPQSVACPSVAGQWATLSCTTGAGCTCV